MECQKITNLFDVTMNQTPRFRTKNWVEINDEWYFMKDNEGFFMIWIILYDNGSIKLKLSMIWSNLCNYSDA